MDDEVVVTPIKRVYNCEHGYSWEVMPNPDAPEYGVTIFYYEPEKTNKTGFHDSDNMMCFSINEAKEIGRALIHIAEEAEATRRKR